MKTSSLGRTARPCAAVDRYQAIDFDEPHRKSVRNTAPKCAPQSRMPRPSHGLPPISIALRQYTSNQRYMKTCQPTHAHTRVHPIIPIQTHLSGKGSLYPDGLLTRTPLFRRIPSWTWRKVDECSECQVDCFSSSMSRPTWRPLPLKVSLPTTARPPR